MGQIDKNIPVLVLSAQREHTEIVLKALKKVEFKTIHVMDHGLEALQKVVDVRYGFILCDQNIRFISGWLLIKEIKTTESLPNMPVVLFGREDPPDSEEKMKRYGIMRYLKFPSAIHELDFVINSTLNLFHTSGTVENKFTLAKDSLLNNRAKEAIEQFSELRSLTKNSTRSSMGLAQAYVQDNNFEQAQVVMEEVAKSDEDSPARTMMQAKLALQKDDVPRAMAAINEVLKQIPDGFYFSRCVRLMMEFNRLKEAAELSNRALGTGIQRPEFYICLAKERYSVQDFAGALKSISDHEKTFGMTGELFNLRGVCYKKAGNFQEAIEAYEQALRLQPSDARVYFNLAMCAIGMKKMDEAAAYLQSCLKYAPNFPKAKEKLDEILRRASA